MRGASPRLRSAHLGEPKAPNVLVSTTPRRGLLHLGIGPCLGELKSYFSFFFFISLILETINSLLGLRLS